ncbi:hypothetical protein M2175_002344 [Bradyrhizobium elkanii]|nr:hypothetical protein [Bradyrhizobium elkanii]MCS3967866.1 hypothetical protein [Bradyrhizobium japonicum]
MSFETTMTSDVVGLTKVAPVSRRGFMSATAAVAAGYTLAAGPVRAEIIRQIPAASRLATPGSRSGPKRCLPISRARPATPRRR